MFSDIKKGKDRKWDRRYVLAYYDTLRNRRTDISYYDVIIIILLTLKLDIRSFYVKILTSEDYCFNSICTIGYVRILF